MDTKELLTVVGWFVAFVLGIGAKWLGEKLTAKRRLLDWEVTNEADLSVGRLSERMKVPVRILIGDKTAERVSTVTVTIKNSGNDLIQQCSAAISFGALSTVLKSPDTSEFGEFGNHVRFVEMQQGTRVEFGYLNSGQTVKLTWVLTDYKKGSTEVDVAAPGARIRKGIRDTERLYNSFERTMLYVVPFLAVTTLLITLWILIMTRQSLHSSR